jgi:hypothetical protein
MNRRFRKGLLWRTDSVWPEVWDFCKDVMWYVAAVIIAFALMFLAVDRQYATAAEAEGQLLECLNGGAVWHYVDAQGVTHGVKCAVEEIEIGRMK